MATTIDNVLSEITVRLEAGVAPWRRPWSADAVPCRPLRADRQSFSGSNLVMLAITAAARGYASPFWLTFRQAREAGGTVRRGESGTPALLFKTRIVEAATPDEADEIDCGSVRRYSKPYYVFNADQIDGLPDQYCGAPPVGPELRPAICDAALAAVPARIEMGGDQAYYDRHGDLIRMPHPERFTTLDDFRATLWHELAHWTGAETRLARVFGRRFGDAAYAFEELVALSGQSAPTRSLH